jgi:imidazolonepropionase-like amidohydrolase
VEPGHPGAGRADGGEGRRERAHDPPDGLTTIGDGGCRGLVGPASRDAIAQGIVPGPRVIAAGQILCGTAGLLDSMLPWVRYESAMSLGRVVDGPGAVRRAVREQVKGGVDFIKVAASGVAGSPYRDAETEDLDVGEIRAAVREAARHRRWVHAHAHSAESIKVAISHAPFGLLRAVLGAR